MCVKKGDKVVFDVIARHQIHIQHDKGITKSKKISEEGSKYYKEGQNSLDLPLNSS